MRKEKRYTVLYLYNAICDLETVTLCMSCIQYLHIRLCISDCGSAGTVAADLFSVTAMNKCISLYVYSKTYSINLLKPINRFYLQMNIGLVCSGFVL